MAMKLKTTSELVFDDNTTNKHTVSTAVANVLYSSPIRKACL